MCYLWVPTYINHMQVTGVGAQPKTLCSDPHVCFHMGSVLPWDSIHPQTLVGYSPQAFEGSIHGSPVKQEHRAITGCHCINSMGVPLDSAPL